MKLQNIILNKCLLWCKGKALQLGKQPLLEWGLLAMTIIPFVLISAFNHPADDDFQGAVLARSLGLGKSIAYYYQHWTGRYTSILLYSVVYEASDLAAWLTALRVAPVFFLMALVAAGHFAAGGLSSRLANATKWKAVGYGLVLYLCGIPSVASALYWFNGAAVYTSGIVLSLFLIGLAGRYNRNASSVARATWGILSTGVVFLLVGTNELYMVVALVGVVMWLSYEVVG